MFASCYYTLQDLDFLPSFCLGNAVSRSYYNSTLSCYAGGCLNLANVVTECKESKACSPAKHHFDECVERVTGADHGKPVDKKHPEEDCVEECKSS
jgi:hypothetical protein